MLWQSQSTADPDFRQMPTAITIGHAAQDRSLDIFMRALSLACALALGITSFTTVAATAPIAAKVPGSEAIVSKTLANGLQIIVWPDHDIPNANLDVYKRQGGAFLARRIGQ